MKFFKKNKKFRRSAKDKRNDEFILLLKSFIDTIIINKEDDIIGRIKEDILDTSRLGIKFLAYDYIKEIVENEGKFHINENDKEQHKIVLEIEYKIRNLFIYKGYYFYRNMMFFNKKDRFLYLLQKCLDGGKGC